MNISGFAIRELGLFSILVDRSKSEGKLTYSAVLRLLPAPSGIHIQYLTETT